MRTKASEFAEQEKTWIYLLHQQTPPESRSSTAAANSGEVSIPVIPPSTVLAPLPSVVYGHHAPHTYGSSSGTDAGQNILTSAYGGPKYNEPSSSTFPSTSAYPVYPHGEKEFIMKRPLQLSQPWMPSHPSSSGRCVLRPIVSKSEEYAAMKQEIHYAAASTYKSESSTSSSSSSRRPSAAGLIELLPKKHRRDEDVPSTKQQQQQPQIQQDDDMERNAKRNCFPKKCDFPMCKNSSRSRGFCYSHGGGRRCRMEGCTNGAVSRDLCKRHGGGRRCRISGCKSSSESGGLCYSHGGGRRCSLSWCSARAKKGGFCAVHLADEKADQPPQSSSTSSAAPSKEETVHPNVVETLLSLAQDKNVTAQVETNSSSGEKDVSSPTSPSLQTPRSAAASYSIASILN